MIANSNKHKPLLYYIHDPMCSWCWGFRPVWQSVQERLKDEVEVCYLLGGLAADTDTAMPLSMQTTIQSTWRRIQQAIPGTVFNYEFWTNCQPRRSTYPACRAIIAASMQDEKAGKLMLLAIQQAYYQRAKNPSDDAVLLQLAVEIGLDRLRFLEDINSDQCKQRFRQQRELVVQLGVNSFPSLVLHCNESNMMIYIDYTNDDAIISSVRDLL